MGQPRTFIAIGVGALLLAAGCEDLPPTAVTPVGQPASGSPAPSGSPGPTPFPAVTPTPTPTPVPSAATPTPFATGTAGPTATPVPTPTPTVAPTSGPNYQDVPITFLEPAAGADFTRTNLTIKVQATAVGDDKIRAIQLYYDNLLIASQEGAEGILKVENWNPNIANSVENADLTPVPFGFHRLRARVLTEKGYEDNEYYAFNKPFVFKGWRRDVINNGNTLPIPHMLSSRARLGAYGRLDRLFAFFGETGGSAPEPTIEMINVAAGSPVWEYRTLGGLLWRERPGVVGLNSKVFVIGGNVQSVSGAMMPTPLVTMYDLFSLTTEQAPPLGLPAVPVADMGAAVLNNYLYLVGGTTNGLPSGATGNAYRLALTRDGLPVGTGWELVKPLPGGVRRLGGALVNYNGALYLLGGQDERGNRSEYVFKYDPASDTWSTARFLHRGLSHAAAIVMGGDIWLFGGYTNVFPSITNEVARYRPETGATTTFSSDVTLPSGRAGAAATVVNGQMYLLGGSRLDEQGNEVPTDEVLRADTL